MFSEPAKEKNQCGIKKKWFASFFPAYIVFCKIGLESTDLGGEREVLSIFANVVHLCSPDPQSNAETSSVPF